MTLRRASRPGRASATLFFWALRGVPTPWRLLHWFARPAPRRCWFPVPCPFDHGPGPKSSRESSSVPSRRARRVRALDTYAPFIEGLADLVATSLQGPEVSLDAAAELPNKVKLYPQDKWAWGWNNSSEVWNGQLAMLGFSAFLLEVLSGRGPLHALGLL